METVEIMQVLAQGEDSYNQFKKDVTNIDALAIEIIAFSNTLGGRIFIGVDDEGVVTGLSADDVHRINQLLSNAASQNVKPAVNPLSKIVMIDDQRIMVVEIAKGINKPYQDKNGVFWVKSGADKRKAISREEIQRLFQDSGLVHADVMPANRMTVADIDMAYFREFFQKRYGESLAEQSIPLEQTITNLNLGKNEELNITGALLFAQSPSSSLPSFIVKAAVFPGVALATDDQLPLG